MHAAHAIDVRRTRTLARSPPIFRTFTTCVLSLFSLEVIITIVIRGREAEGECSTELEVMSIKTLPLLASIKYLHYHQTRR